MESHTYYAGYLPARAWLLALAPLLFRGRNPRVQGAFTEIKAMKATGNHPLNDVWEDKSAPLVLDILESKSVKFTSVDVVRIGVAEEPSLPVVVWIGVLLESLSPLDGLMVALQSSMPATKQGHQ